jgi:tRNA A37 threonylcarbamoyladenosine dehydratase
MAEWTERAELLFKKEGLDKLHNANVYSRAGGVGSLQLSFGYRAGVVQ